MFLFFTGNWWLACHKDKQFSVWSFYRSFFLHDSHPFMYDSFSFTVSIHPLWASPSTPQGTRLVNSIDTTPVPHRVWQSHIPCANQSQQRWDFKEMAHESCRCFNISLFTALDYRHIKTITFQKVPLYCISMKENKLLKLLFLQYSTII